MTDAPPAGKLGLAEVLVRVSHLVQHVFADVSRARELTPQQTQVLCLLNDGPVGMTDLGRLLRLEKSSLTGLVDRLERRGLIERVRDAQDRRACWIALTPHGTRIGTEAHDAIVSRLETITETLSPADRERVGDLLTRLITQ